MACSARWLRGACRWGRWSPTSLASESSLVVQRGRASRRAPARTSSRHLPGMNLVLTVAAQQPMCRTAHLLWSPAECRGSHRACRTCRGGGEFVFGKSVGRPRGSAVPGFAPTDFRRSRSSADCVRPPTDLSPAFPRSSWVRPLDQREGPRRQRAPLVCPSTPRGRAAIGRAR